MINATKRLALTLAFLSLFLFCRAGFAFQGEMGMRVDLPVDEKVHSDIYLLGSRVTIDGEVNGDLIVLGGVVRVHGPVHGNVYLAGGNIDIDGPVDGEINILALSAESKSVSRVCRIVAVDAVHAGKTFGDLLAFGWMVDTKGIVEGDTLIGGEALNIGGTHQQDLQVMGHNVFISGKIKGDAEIKADSLSLEKPAHFGGNLAYTTPRELEITPQKVEGEITHSFPPPRLPAGLHVPWLYPLSHKLFSALWLTVVGLVSLTWFPRSSQSVVDTMLHSPWESFFVGLALFIAIPGVAVILLVSLLGIPLGIFLFAILGVGVYLTRLFGSLYIGERLLGALEHHMPPYWQSLPLGVFLFTMLTSIPYFGAVVSVVVIPLALGAKALLGWRLYRRMRSRHLA